MSHHKEKTMSTDIYRGRHPATRELIRWFEYGHLPDHLQLVSRGAAMLASQMVYDLPDSAELSTGLRKLLEAKDCFVRAALLAHEDKVEDQA